MKIVLTSLAAALMATAAAAQTTPTDQSMTAPPTSTMTPSADPAATPPAADTGMAADQAMLTEKDGKWYNGDREATKTEIAAYKKAKKAGRPG